MTLGTYQLKSECQWHARFYSMCERCALQSTQYEGFSERDILLKLAQKCKSLDPKFSKLYASLIHNVLNKAEYDLGPTLVKSTDKM